MNSSSRIFVFILLFGMLCTVVSYLPLTEDLLPKKTELAKKTDAGGEGEDTDEGGDQEEDSMKDFIVGGSIAIGLSADLKGYSRYASRLYCTEPGDKCGPPPKA